MFSVLRVACYVSESLTQHVIRSTALIKYQLEISKNNAANGTLLMSIPQKTHIQGLYR